MRIGTVFAVLGLLLRPFAAVLLVPAAIDLPHEHPDPYAATTLARTRAWATGPA